MYLEQIICNHILLSATDLEVCIIKSTYISFGFYKVIDILFSTDDYVECVRNGNTRGMQSAMIGFLVR